MGKVGEHRPLKTRLHIHTECLLICSSHNARSQFYYYIHKIRRRRRRFAEIFSSSIFSYSHVYNVNTCVWYVLYVYFVCIFISVCTFIYKNEKNAEEKRNSISASAMVTTVTVAVAAATVSSDRKIINKGSKSSR